MNISDRQRQFRNRSLERGSNQWNKGKTFHDENSAVVFFLLLSNKENLSSDGATSVYTCPLLFSPGKKKQTGSHQLFLSECWLVWYFVIMDCPRTKLICHKPHQWQQKLKCSTSLQSVLATNESLKHSFITWLTKSARTTEELDECLHHFPRSFSTKNTWCGKFL